MSNINEGRKISPETPDEVVGRAERMRRQKAQAPKPADLQRPANTGKGLPAVDASKT